jgi:hypothetical protein
MHGLAKKAFAIRSGVGLVGGSGGIAPITVPTAPTGLSATPVSATQINLAWTDNATDETGYRVYRSSDGGSTYVQIGVDQPIGLNTYNDTTVTGGIRYYYKVSAYNTGGETYSEPASTNTLLLGLLHYWKLGESSGNRLDSVTSGAINLTPNTPALVSQDTAGIVGSCVTFAGGVGSKLTGSAIQCSATGFTVWGWLKVPAYAATAVQFAAAGGAVAWILQMVAQNSWRFQVGDSVSGDSRGNNTTLPSALDTWFFLCGRYNASTKKAELRVNAAPWAVGAALANGPRQDATGLTISATAATSPASSIDEIGQFNRYLSDAEVDALYNGGSGNSYPFEISSLPPGDFLQVWYATASNAAAPLTTPTYDGSGQATHPSIVDAGGGGWNGHRYWMAHTPYAGSNDGLENPSVYYSEDGQTGWTEPVGLTNPVVTNPGSGFNSDSDLFLDADSTMWLFYRYADTAAPVNVYFRAKTSTDGVVWSAPIALFQGVAGDFVSPSVIAAAGKFYMFTVKNSAGRMERREADALSGPWSAPTDCGVVVPVGVPWHMDVITLDNDHLVMAVVNGANDKIYLAESIDRGLTWYCGTHLISRRIGEWDQVLYRPTLLRTATGFGLWYGANNGGTPAVWHIGYTPVTL